MKIFLGSKVVQLWSAVQVSHSIQGQNKSQSCQMPWCAKTIPKRHRRTGLAYNLLLLEFGGKKGKVRLLSGKTCPGAKRGIRDREGIKQS